MPCPNCKETLSRVIDSRLHDSTHSDGEIQGPARRRRHICLACNGRFTTYETIYQKKSTVLEEFISKVVHYRRRFGVESNPNESAYEAMEAIFA